MSLHTTLNGESQATLRHALKLSQSGAVRLVNRLARAGLVVRSPGPDQRTHAVTLTEAGTRAAHVVIEARATALAALLDPLDREERAWLAGALKKILAGVASDLRGAYRTCRLCDPVACGHHEGLCPITQATSP